MRIVGIETEYGVADARDPGANPILLSSALVAAYRASVGAATAHWDYAGEDPLHDQRGYWRDRGTGTLDGEMPEGTPDPAEGTVTRRRRRGAWEDPAHLNAVLSNGARFYVDHAHPEVSCPEVTNALDAVLWGRAGDEIVREAALAVAADGAKIALYKNNVDGKGASYGTHENYLTARSVPFDELALRVTSHLVTRQVFTGSGRVGLGQRGEEPGFQISQRADYIEADVGLETTLRRPIVNTRDEPHADPARWRRLHVIIGDANCMDVPTYLKVGTTSLVLSAIEAGDARLDSLVLASPVPAVQAVSHDLALTRPLPLAVGAEATAIDIQYRLLEIAREYADDSEDSEVVRRWEEVLDGLSRDRAACSPQVEWVAKLGFLERLRERHATGGEPLRWDDPIVQAADIQWSDLDPGHGLCARLTAAGAIERLVSDGDIVHAIGYPPNDTRAWLRGRMVGRRSDIVDAAGWSTVVIDRDTDHGDLEVVRLDDPYATSHPLLDELLAP